MNIEEIEESFRKTKSGNNAHLNNQNSENSMSSLNSNQKNFNMNKRITDNFFLNSSGTSSVDKKKLPHSFVKEDTNSFLAFEHAHRQMSFLGKTFKTINNKELNNKLDFFLEQEFARNKVSFPHIEFSIEAIIDRTIKYKDTEVQNTPTPTNLTGGSNVAKDQLNQLEPENQVKESEINAVQQRAGTGNNFSSPNLIQESTGNNYNIVQPGSGSILNTNYAYPYVYNTEKNEKKLSITGTGVLKPEPISLTNFSLNSENMGNNILNSPNSVFKFLVISNIFIYEFEFCLINSTLSLSRKLNLLSIEFFSITPDFKKLIIHVNNILDTGGNSFITNENSIHIVFCLCNILFYCYSTTKNLIVIPHSTYFYEKSKKIHSYEKVKIFYNKFVDEIFNKIGSSLPYDKDENFVKLVPLSKIETKYTDTKTDKMIILTNKKILEISSDNMDLSKINIFPLSKMKKINEFYKSHKFQIVFDDGNTIQYSSIHSKAIIRLIKTQHNNECLLELEVIRCD